MIDVIRFTNIQEIADRVMKHPLLQDVQFESIITHTVDFLELFGFKDLYLTKVDTVIVRDYRAKLPCSLIRINQVRTPDGICFKAMSSNFFGSLEQPAFKTQGDYLYTNIKDCCLEVSYETMPVDDDGYPLIFDNAKFKLALYNYIKKERFDILFSENKISQAVLGEAQKEYAFSAARLRSAMTIPTESEMQSITNMWNRMHLTVQDFYNGFELQSNTETYKIH